MREVGTDHLSQRVSKKEGSGVWLEGGGLGVMGQGESEHGVVTRRSMPTGKGGVQRKSRGPSKALWECSSSLPTGLDSSSYTPSLAGKI